MKYLMMNLKLNVSSFYFNFFSRQFNFSVFFCNFIKCIAVRRPPPTTSRPNQSQQFKPAPIFKDEEDPIRLPSQQTPSKYKFIIFFVKPKFVYIFYNLH